MKSFLKFFVLLTLVSLPLFSFAQDSDGYTYDDEIQYFSGGESALRVCAENIENIGDFICKISSLLTALLPLLVILGVIYFVWGVITYVIKDEEEAKTKGRDRMIWGIIGLTVIVGLWGLVFIVTNTFGLERQDAIVNPLSNIPVGDNTSQIASTCKLPDNPKLQDLMRYAVCIINTGVVPLIFALAVVMFIWGVVKFFINSADEENKEKGRQFMIWGIIALAVMTSIWGLVKIVGTTFGVQNVIPQVKSR